MAEIFGHKVRRLAGFIGDTLYDGVRENGVNVDDHVDGPAGNYGFVRQRSLAIDKKLDAVHSRARDQLRHCRAFEKDRFSFSEQGFILVVLELREPCFFALRMNHDVVLVHHRDNDPSESRSVRELGPNVFLCHSMIGDFQLTRGG